MLISFRTMLNALNNSIYIVVLIPMKISSFFL